MHVAVLGAGGREQAIAHACRLHGHRVELIGDTGTGPDAAIEAAIESAPDLVIVGPEAMLAAGAAERCRAAGIPCFGPTSDVARLETSKSYARALTRELGIPSPAATTYPDGGSALAGWNAAGRPNVVVKRDGLAGGKGVIVPHDAATTEAAIRMLGAHGPILLEEQLSGPECTLLALCDGRHAVALPLAQDHKRIGAGDTGPNTGGMGAFAPAMQHLDPSALTATFVQPVLDHLAEAGTPYVGVLYAGLMVTADGPKLIEYNCRFGDPEAQAVLALLRSDLAELALACTTGNLAGAAVDVDPGAAVTVVAAAPGYPDAAVLGAPVTVNGEPRELATTVALDGALLHPSGVSAGPAPVTTAGRVLSVTGTGPTLAEAREQAYGVLYDVEFDGMYVRPDIGWRAHAAGLASYASTGVDIDEGSRAVAQMKAAVEATHGPAVLRGVGSFGGAFSAAALREMTDPVLVGSTDGVGTKVELAARTGRYRGVGLDIVNHCVNDVLVQGARPLFFLDYVAASRISAGMVAEIVAGMAEACAANGCALLGGETAEMPGVYQPGAFDIAGTLVGVVDRPNLLPRAAVQPGDTLIGLLSNGPHTNGYSLLRNLFSWLPLDARPAPLDRSLADALLEPHRSYLGLLGPVLRHPALKAMAHITGGGLQENLPRVLPDGVAAEIDLGSWPLPPIFQLVQQVATGIERDELYRTLNMGVGMVLVTDQPDALAEALPEQTYVIGRLVDGPRTVTLR